MDKCYQNGKDSQELLLPVRCIYPEGNILFTGWVKSIYEIRRENLKVVIAGRFKGSQAKFAEAMGFNEPSFVSRLLSTKPNTAKTIGARIARKIEKICKLEEHSMDRESGSGLIPDDIIDMSKKILALPPERVAVLRWIFRTPASDGDVEKAFGFPPEDDKPSPPDKPRKRK